MAISSFDEDNLNVFRLWGVDLGIGSPFVASDGSERGPPKATDSPQMSAAELYTLAKYKHITKRIKKHKNTCDDEPGAQTIVEIESELQMIVRVSLRMSDYQDRRWAEEEMMQVIFNDRRKHNHVGMKHQYSRPHQNYKPPYNIPCRPSFTVHIPPSEKNGEIKKSNSEALHYDDNFRRPENSTIFTIATTTTTTERHPPPVDIPDKEHP
ncbi:hypothetical protein K501DRAFT_279206 [Backusella circina FSU 941]|nr:hypothetical protein K501DRAFT_279206 [Backusella circina FSU 941]